MLQDSSVPAPDGLKATSFLSLSFAVLPAASGTCVRKIPVASPHPLDPQCFHGNENPHLHQLLPGLTFLPLELQSRSSS